MISIKSLLGRAQLPKRQYLEIPHNYCLGQKGDEINAVVKEAMDLIPKLKNEKFSRAEGELEIYYPLSVNKASFVLQSGNTLDYERKPGDEVFTYSVPNGTQYRVEVKLKSVEEGVYPIITYMYIKTSDGKERSVNTNAESFHHEALPGRAAYTKLFRQGDGSLYSSLNSLINRCSADATRPIADREQQRHDSRKSAVNLHQAAS